MGAKQPYPHLLDLANKNICKLNSSRNHKQGWWLKKGAFGRGGQRGPDAFYEWTFCAASPTRHSSEFRYRGNLLRNSNDKSWQHFM